MIHHSDAHDSDFPGRPLQGAIHKFGRFETLGLLRRPQTLSSLLLECQPASFVSEMKERTMRSAKVVGSGDYGDVESSRSFEYASSDERSKLGGIIIRSHTHQLDLVVKPKRHEQGENVVRVRADIGVE